ncbi:CatB-related O-acetyltransferase [Maribacter sp.]|nr:CatB-related O-acetyltransferase [Maribacter sp.]
MNLIRYFLGFLYGIALRFRKVKIHPLARITLKSEFEGMNRINRNVVFVDSFLGRGTYINNASYFVRSKIGRFCSIGANVKLITGEHPLNRNVATHPSFFSLKKQAGFTFSEEQTFKEVKFADDNDEYCIIIENDVWIGTNVLLLSGITIKTGAVVAAGAVVTKDVEPYTIVAGIPAKKIKSRFTEAEIDYLLESKWWDKSVDWLKKNYRSFEDFETFKSKNETYQR